jgi:hypothetical protein
VQTETKNFAEYLYANIMVDDSSVQEIDSFDAQAALKAMPKRAYGFRLFQRRFTPDEDETVMKSDRLNETGIHYPDGQYWTLAKVKKEMPDESTLIRNMESNHWPRVIRNRYGQFRSPRDNDIIM